MKTPINRLERKETGFRIPGLLMILLAVLLAGCENDLLEQAQTAREATVLPVLTTSDISSKGTATATAGGNITDDGGLPIVERGICWSTSSDPTLHNHFQKEGGDGTGSYSVPMSGLLPGTRYYARAYASNSVATGYGPQISFTTVPAAPSAPSVTAIGYSSGSGKVIVSWTDGNGSATTSYDLYCGTTSTIPADPYSGYSGIQAKSCTVEGLANFTSYYFWIVARTLLDESPPSASGTGSAGVAVTSVTLDRIPQVVLPGSSEVLSVTVLPADATSPNLTWATTNSAVLSLSDTSNTGGTVTGLNPGTATISIVPDDGQGASAGFTAEYRAASIGTIGPAGGLVIYDKGAHSDGWRYIEAANDTVGSGLMWRGTVSINIPDAYNDDWGAGKINTEAIINAQGEGNYMAMACVNYRQNGYADWYMPSKTEANEILAVKPVSYRENFEWFFSSTQYAIDACWAFHAIVYNTWVPKDTNSNITYQAVCPVRRF